MAAKAKGRPRNSKTSRRSRAPAAEQFIARADRFMRVRMYRLGLGECILLTLPRQGTPFHMLIDCGAPLGPQKAHSTIKQVADDIWRTTEGRLDVLMVTHRHWNHISGFLNARDTFERMAVEQVWLGWTEDPNDAQAIALEPGGATRSSGAGSRSVQAMNVVRSIGRTMRYWRGGEGPVAISGVPGARVFFLAPPTMRTDRGSARRAMVSTGRATASPFNEQYRVASHLAQLDSRFYRYFLKDKDWRAPNFQSVDEIAARTKTPIPYLQLDRESQANNTSLVIAIEFMDSNNESKVLLFPGDAQIPSWWSWHEHRWPPDDPNGMTCATLLSNTVLYKVSHNGARSGTATQVGLDMMTNPELVALISVDEDDARMRRWLMPAPDLLSALIRMTQGRVIRTDIGVEAGKPQDSGLTDLEWQQFQDAVSMTDLYIDHQISLPTITAGEAHMLEANWTAANERRVYLVDKKLAGTIRPEEEAELRELDRLVDEYMRATAPSGLELLAELRDSIKDTVRTRK